MTKPALRWWLWVSLTLIILIIAGIFGFYTTLIQQDATYLGLGVLGLYLISTAWLGFKLRCGNDDYGFLWYISELMERAGLLGTFIGLAIAFQAMRHMDSGGEWKHELITGISTKFLCSIVGLTGAIFLKTQIKILRSGHEE